MHDPVIAEVIQQRAFHGGGIMTIIDHTRTREEIYESSRILGNQNSTIRCFEDERKGLAVISHIRFNIINHRKKPTSLYLTKDSPQQYFVRMPSSVCVNQLNNIKSISFLNIKF